MPGRIEYEKYAAQCVLLARATENPDQRIVLLTMAQSWRRLARQAEKISALAHPGDPGSI
jgi:hypothetical protein